MRISDWSSDVCSSDLKLCGLKEQLKIITLDGELEQLLVSSVRADPSGAYPLDPALSQRILTALGEAAKPLLADGTTFAVVTTPLVRRPLFQLLRQHLPDVTVLSFSEIPDSRQVQVVAGVGRGPAYQHGRASCG